ncbi:MAG: hypothetical protein KF752_14250 [Pirellulaceae bacterium]|nr:hypothetical protein [Pirellulaceae bacterium]
MRTSICFRRQSFTARLTGLLTWSDRVFFSLAKVLNHNPRLTVRRLIGCLSFFILTFIAVAFAGAQPTESDGSDSLATGQQQVATQLSRLETLLLRSADIEALDNPTRAALLQQAAGLSKQAQLADLLERAARHLSDNRLSEAIDQQKSGRDALKRLLEMLQSENREQRVRQQRDQVRRWIEETDRLLRMQSSLRGRTEGGQSAQQAALDQAQLANKAQQIAGELDSSTAESADSGKDASDQQVPPSTDGSDRSSSQDLQQPTDAKPQDGSTEPSSTEQPPESQSASEPAAEQQSSDQPMAPDKQASSNKPSERDQASSEQPANASSDQPSDKPSDGQPAADQQPSPDDSQSTAPPAATPNASPPSQAQPTPSQPSSPSEPSPSEPSEGQQSSGSPSGDSSPPEPQTPAERAAKRIQQARQRMQEAQQQLQDAQREQAVEKQLQAEQQLKEALEDLEEILNQLREEEIRRSLETLESRLRRMLELHTNVVSETQRLHDVAGDQPDRQILTRAATLGREEQKVAAEGERALLLLREEGSSAAFPEALVQVNQDITGIILRLETGDVGRITLVMQNDVLQALQEMVEAIAKVKQDNQQREKQRQQSMPGQEQEPGAQPLVDKLAELRLIRTLQLRINTRTAALSNMLKDPTDPIGQVEAEDLLAQLRQLGGRQVSVEQVTRNIMRGD